MKQVIFVNINCRNGYDANAPIHLFRVIFVEVLAERHVGRIHWRGWHIWSSGWHVRSSGWHVRSSGWHVRSCGWHVRSSGWNVWSSCGGCSGGTHSVGAHGRATAPNRSAGFSVGIPEGSLGTRLADNGFAGADEESIFALGITQISRFGTTASQRLATFTPKKERG